jgi:hypothetical protein
MVSVMVASNRARNSSRAGIDRRASPITTAPSLASMRGWWIAVKPPQGVGNIDG